MINRDEFMKMAREAGFDVIGPNDHLNDAHVVMEGFLEFYLSSFASAILERAAVECGNVQLSLNTYDALDDAALRIRALKTQGE